MEYVSTDTGANASITAKDRQPPATPSLRARVDGWVESAVVQRIVIVVIIANAIILGLQTTSWASGSVGSTLMVLDTICLVVFVTEIVAKLYGKGFAFFRSGWNVFDFFVVAVALVPDAGGFAVLRTLRILRLISLVKRLRFVIEALAGAIPGIASIGTLLLLMFYVGAVMATSLFSETFPEWFGNVGASAYSLFQVMTLESWSMGIARPVMEVHPWAWAFFVPFVVLSAFAVLNLFVAVIVDSMQNLREVPDAWPDESEAEKEVHETRSEMAELRSQVSDLQRDLREALVLLRERGAPGDTQR
ncbi:ion transporter [Microbacterium amylolyticum]|uniref:Voltage-gated sodium channel n=1 Tax=Microbacterium amylolyticum TaxID=936337 RepID=A0ABS4ZGA2_9MICO|nr:ion transporter [Microbacterium amylolyticum]MBP2436043.1 voltage-gated sodium channel [Microbacterium amylolyticum]